MLSLVIFSDGLQVETTTAWRAKPSQRKLASENCFWSGNGFLSHSIPGQTKPAFHSVSLCTLPLYLPCAVPPLHPKISFIIRNCFYLVKRERATSFYLGYDNVLKFHLYSALAFHSCHQNVLWTDLFAIGLVFVSKWGAFSLRPFSTWYKVWLPPSMT